MNLAVDCEQRLADLSGDWGSGLRNVRPFLVPSQYITHLSLSQVRASSRGLCLMEYSPGALNSICPQ